MKITWINGRQVIKDGNLILGEVDKAKLIEEENRIEAMSGLDWLPIEDYGTKERVEQIVVERIRLRKIEKEGA